jgi:hypothetical protein
MKHVRGFNQIQPRRNQGRNSRDPRLNVPTGPTFKDGAQNTEDARKPDFSLESRL